MIQDVLAAGADVYVTGDIDHHTGIDTVARGLQSLTQVITVRNIFLWKI